MFASLLHCHPERLSPVTLSVVEGSWGFFDKLRMTLEYPAPLHKGDTKGLHTVTLNAFPLSP